MSASLLVARLDAMARERPAAIALDDGNGVTVAYAELPALVRRAAVDWAATGARVGGLLAHNGLDSVVAWLGAIAAGIAVVPLPPFFSAAQLDAVAARAGIDVIVTDDPKRVTGFQHVSTRTRDVVGLHAFVRVDRSAALKTFPNTHLITFTSGTTASPKGVLLSDRSLLAVAESLARRTTLDTGRRHLCVMPFSVLLESVGGVLRSLVCGATAVVPDLPSIGMRSICDVDGPRLARAMHRLGATDAILVPESLRILLDAFEREPAPQRLRFLGVGGAPVPREAHHKAAALGVPVFEGYGLTEAASVVALNSAGCARIGSVGKPLAHVTLKIDEHGELLVRGAILNGYVGAPDPFTPDGFLKTGDLAELDDDGFLWLRGRIGEFGITSFARNIQPSWIEELLTRSPRISQAAALIESRRFPVAVLVSDASPAELAADVAAANAELPAYARIETYVVTSEPFSTHNGQWNAFGKLNRGAIERAYRDRLDARTAVEKALAS